MKLSIIYRNQSIPYQVVSIIDFLLLENSHGEDESSRLLDLHRDLEKSFQTNLLNSASCGRSLSYLAFACCLSASLNQARTTLYAGSRIRLMMANVLLTTILTLPTTWTQKSSAAKPTAAVTVIPSNATTVRNSKSMDIMELME